MSAGPTCLRNISAVLHSRKYIDRKFSVQGPRLTVRVRKMEQCSTSSTKIGNERLWEVILCSILAYHLVCCPGLAVTLKRLYSVPQVFQSGICNLKFERNVLDSGNKTRWLVGYVCILPAIERAHSISRHNRQRTERPCWCTKQQKVISILLLKGH